MKRSVITGTGSCIPDVIIRNEDFLAQPFFSEDGEQIPTKPEVLVEKFRKITGISERRYARPGQVASDLAVDAGRSALADSGIDPETLDLLIVAHNFGDVRSSGQQADTVPSLASRVKHRLGIRNPACVAFDVLFGCPGWNLAVMQADAFFKAGMGKKALIIGTETLSRIIDRYDRDSMIFSDGAGAVVLEWTDSGGGILSASALSHCSTELEFLQMEPSFHPEAAEGPYYMKMKGRKVYEYALTHVPEAMKACLEKSGCALPELKKIFIHQANEKMDEAIVQAFYGLYGQEAPAGIMPMCIQYLGNSSVATIPTLLDRVRRGGEAGHFLHSGDLLLFASVGAGMNINAFCYRYP
ncbi:MAG TPA: ketoacyl-ACP synthase III [Chitinophagaceae bacterium]|jgi:3-oxoacyl-[acyl-carrier-protein] synthase-3|nr:ketoacyl-ACP synthase III [Chitinophagaceae bacterium]